MLILKIFLTIQSWQLAVEKGPSKSAKLSPRQLNYLAISLLSCFKRLILPLQLGQSCLKVASSAQILIFANLGDHICMILGVGTQC